MGVAHYGYGSMQLIGVFKKYSKDLNKDFYKNRELLEDKVKFPNNKIENRVVGYVTTLVKRERA